MPSDVQTEITEDAPDDVRAQLSAAFDAQTGVDQPVEQAEQTQAERIRDEAGRFARAEQTEPEPGSTAEPTTEPAAEQPSTHEPPAHWGAVDKEAFQELTPKAQAAWLRRDQEMTADYTRKTTEIAAFRREYEPVDQLFKPFEQQIRDAGFTKAGLIQAWAGVERKLTGGQGVDVVRDLVQNYRLDREQIARALGLSVAPRSEGAPPAPESTPVQLPPEVHQTLQNLQQQQSQFNQFLRQQQEQQMAESTHRVMSTITAFKDAKDASGALLHPHFDTLEGEMTNLLAAARQAGQNPTLDELYDKAVWANTSTRTQLLNTQSAAQQAQRAADEKKQRDEARAKAERARRAGSSVTGTPGSSQAAIAAARAEGASVKDALEAAWDAHAA